MISLKDRISLEYEPPLTPFTISDDSVYCSITGQFYYRKNMCIYIGKSPKKKNGNQIIAQIIETI